MRDPIEQVRRAARAELERLRGSESGVETGPVNRDGSVRTMEGIIAAPPAPSFDGTLAVTSFEEGDQTEQWPQRAGRG